MDEQRAEIAMRDPVELLVDGPRHRIYTPLGPLLRAGLNPVADLQAFAVTAEREWFSPIQPLIHSQPPAPVTPNLLHQGLEKLRDEAEEPPRVGNVIALNEEQPHLPGA